MSLTAAGRLFHARDAATGNERSPRVDDTNSVVLGDAAGRLRRRAATSVLNWRDSARYDGAVPWRHLYARTHNWNLIPVILWAHTLSDKICRANCKGYSFGNMIMIYGNDLVRLWIEYLSLWNVSMYVLRRWFCLRLHLATDSKPVCWYLNKTLRYQGQHSATDFGTNRKLIWLIIGQIFASDRRVPHFNALTSCDPCKYRHKWYIAKTRLFGLQSCRRKYRTCVFNHFCAVGPESYRIRWNNTK